MSLGSINTELLEYLYASFIKYSLLRLLIDKITYATHRLIPGVQKLNDKTMN